MSLSITALGACTPVGVDLWTTLASQRAGLSAFEDLEDEGHEFSGSRLSRLPRNADRTARCAFLAEHALRDLVRRSPDDLERTPILVALPDFTGGAVRADEVIAALWRAAPSAPAPRALRLGRAGFFLLLERAAELLEEGDSSVIVGGVDSLVDEVTRDAIRDGALGVERFEPGYVPGEAAAFVRLTRAQGEGPRIERWAASKEPEPRADVFCAEAMTSALEGLGAPPRIDRVRSAHDGRVRGAEELAFMHLRFHEWMPEPIRIDLLGECFADVGAAAPPLAVAIDAHLGGRTLVLGSSDLHLSGACIVEGCYETLDVEEWPASPPAASDELGQELLEDRVGQHLDCVGDLLADRLVELGPEGHWSALQGIEQRIGDHLRAIAAWGRGGRARLDRASESEEPEERAAAWLTLSQDWMPCDASTQALRGSWLLDPDEILDQLRWLLPRAFLREAVRDAMRDPTTFAAGAELAGRHRIHEPIPRLMGVLHTASEPIERRRAAAIALGMLEHAPATSVVGEVASADPSCAEAAFVLRASAPIRWPLRVFAIHATPDNVRAIERALREPESRIEALEALGWLGFTVYVPLLLGALDEPSSAPTAALALERITGWRLFEEVLDDDPEDPDESGEEPPPSTFFELLQRGCEDDEPGHAPTAIGEERCTRRERWSEAWDQHESTLPRGSRLRRGAVLNDAHLLRELAAPERPAAERSHVALELAARRGVPRLEPSWPHERQVQHLQTAIQTTGLLEERSIQ